jgi:hypothetical protein
MKTLLALITALGLCTAATADMVFTPLHWFGDQAASYIQIETGVAWYHNNETYKYGAAADDLAVSLSVVIVDWDYADITCGWMQPLEYTERGRPYFGLITKAEHWGADWAWSWFNPGIGIFGMASPYQAYGVQLNLISHRF